MCSSCQVYPDGVQLTEEKRKDKKPRVGSYLVLFGSLYKSTDTCEENVDLTDP